VKNGFLQCVGRFRHLGAGFCSLAEASCTLARGFCSLAEGFLHVGAGFLQPGGGFSARWRGVSAGWRAASARAEHLRSLARGFSSPQSRRDEMFIEPVRLKGPLRPAERDICQRPHYAPPELRRGLWDRGSINIWSLWDRKHPTIYRKHPKTFWVN
jgi:hypothetical protein